MQLNEIVDDIISRFIPEDYNALRKLTKKELGKYSFYWGMHIRNYYDLWYDSPLTAQFHKDRKAGLENFIVAHVDYHPQHPDQISSDIMEAVWDNVHGS